MSARVCNPVVLSEIAKLRSPAMVRKPMSSSISLARVKRDLFGPVDKQETKNFIDQQLAAQNNALSKKWGFDFSAGEPLKHHDQYQWERVPPTSAPACFAGMVTLTRVAHVVAQSSTSSEDLLDQRAERENGNLYRTPSTRSVGSSASVSGSDSESEISFETARTYPLVLRSDTIMTTASASSVSSNSSSFPASANRAKRQQRITDYLKERKRLSTGAPKSIATKKARHMHLSSASSVISSLPSSPLAQSQNLQ